MSDPIPLVLRFSDWPKADQSAWGELFAEGDIFDGTGPCASWSEGSRIKRRQSYGQWLSWLTRHRPALLEQPPADRVTRDAVRGFMDELEARVQIGTTKNLISDLYVVTRALQPSTDWGWLNTVSKRLIHRADRESLPAAPPLSAGEILAKCLAALEEAETSRHTSEMKQAIRFREALMVGFLISRPVRRRSLLSMTTDRHVRRVGTGYEIHFSAEDMKDKKDRWFPLPEVLAGPMKVYLTTYRVKLLGGADTKALWINQYGDAITPDGLSRQFPKVTERLLGHAVRPHAFRTIAATSIAEQDPEHVNIIRDILGHATLDMAEKHYNRATGLSACSEYQDLVQAILKRRSEKRPKGRQT
ncbi:tyrosine-type recombinase/integrase [Dinoroseobacter sp. PD6]|uniref:tyrosine-type recombinase/integrase n=1 Tax=Dinoroseobacter sp. PD6 TaxID=3028384 RepID=UPI00237A93FA|nr:tyrosine-type recombinase/integrase [Dinoroseobacter sp. PD6]MDD9718627.1 tyrosine-type recombinase/integrase [Dinoroseobacter sp. PD6]